VTRTTRSQEFLPSPWFIGGVFVLPLSDQRYVSGRMIRMWGLDTLSSAETPLQATSFSGSIPS